ncbi:MAG: pyruvate carboxylase [Oscillospiraceae bacterium]|nr:pyruvate carboxylase [Oscillospiraceae bacterium]
MKKINKLLVANRGEIAIRIYRACNELGIRTVGIYSEEDKYNLFRTKADEAYCLGEGKTPLGAYLDIENIIRIAKAKGVDAIHPGYGFLSENANFAEACEAAEIIFVGPPASVLRKMGDKLAAKEIAKACNVPTIPGSDVPLLSTEDAQQRAAEYGYPVILKAAAGGGGRGMRRADTPEELASAFQLVQNEALKSFGNGDIFMEKYLVRPKHIEIQIMADTHGNVVHLFERDCSLQRRYQKVIEIAPALSLTDATKQALYADAVKIAKHVSYVNAGTFEFLVDASGNHYFIEVNPRVQVEHTITEVVTGIDIVQTQIQVARGAMLSDEVIGIPSQESVAVNGVAIQCRVTTEDPQNSFSPDVGKITTYRSSGGFGVRLDAGNAYTGAEISPFYDSLLVKVTAFDRTFEGARRKSIRAINEMRVRGVKTNIQFLSNILIHQQFKSMDLHTTFIDDTRELYNFSDSRDRASKLLSYIGDVVVNGKLTAPANIERPVVPSFSGEKANGLKQILDTGGAEAVKRYVLDSKALLLSDTTMRDAHQSLLATRVRTRDLTAIADYTSFAAPNLFAHEMWGGATFDVTYRFLRECPWERVAQLRKRIPNVPFMMLLRGANAVGYTNYPDNLVQQFIREAATAGIDVFRIFDSLNWLPNMELSIESALETGKLVEGYICYTGDIDDPARDKYTLGYYVNMAKELEKRGVHILGIKDMAGLLKPYAAERLVRALKNEVGLPIHLHTHDSSGNGVAAILKAAEAGLDIADVAISSMAALTSQPSMNAVVTALAGSQRDTGICDRTLQPIASYWAALRTAYAPFESDLKYPSTEVYQHEIPGGQYTNLLAQVKSLGMGERFTQVKEMYADVNAMLGDIVKVTPSSKMVGDFAIFMVQNGLTPQNIKTAGAGLAFPDSVISYMQGMMGQPEGGFDPELRAMILGGRESIDCRPGQLLPPVDWEAVKGEVSAFCRNPEMKELVSYVLYPKVFRDFCETTQNDHSLTTLESPVFFYGLQTDQTTEVEIEEGKTLIIKLVGVHDPDKDGKRRVSFEFNGHRREVMIADSSATAAIVEVTKADPNNPCEIGAGIPGMVSKIAVQVGETVKAGQTLAIIEAMKMETAVAAKCDGVIERILVAQNQSVKAGELVMVVKGE